MRPSAYLSPVRTLFRLLRIYKPIMNFILALMSQDYGEYELRFLQGPTTQSHLMLSRSSPIIQAPPNALIAPLLPTLFQRLG